MKMDATTGRKAGLLGIALLACSLIAVAALGIATRPSHALSPVAANSVPDRLAADGTYTVTMPIVLRNYTPARFTIAKSVTPDSLITSPAALVTYTVTIANIGNEPGVLNAVVDVLPAGFVFQGMVTAESDVDAPPDGTTGTIRWAGTWDFAAGQQMRLVYTVQANETPGTYTNLANVEVEAALPPAGPASATVTVLPGILLQDNFDAGIDRWTPFLNYIYRLAPGQWYWGKTDGLNGSGALTHDALAVSGKVAADALMMYLQPGAEDWTNYRVEVKQYLTGGVTADGQLEPEDGFPIGLWVRGHYQESDINAQWITGYYIVVKNSASLNKHWVRLAQPQIPGDCTTSCDNPNTQYAFNNVKVLCDWFENDCGTAFEGEYDHYRWYLLTVEVRGNNIKAWLDGELAIDYTDDNQPFMTGTVGFKTHETKNASFDDVVVTQLP